MKSLAFGSYVLRTDPRRLLHAGAEVEIGARPLALLHVLLEHPEQTLSKERLIELAWPGSSVSDNLLHVYVNKLRNTVGREWILTVGSEGYRFGGRVRRLGRGASRDLLAIDAPALAGREGEAAELAHALDTHSLVTVVGPGGVGKSALARQVVGNAQADYDDGVLWVDLTHQVDAMQLSGAVAAAAGVSFSDPEAGMGLLAELSARQALLVLDNAEHLGSEVADLCTRLRLKRGGLTVLVTSQVPLLISGEWVVRLGGLAVPAPDSDLAAIAAAPSVRLFCERVQQAERGFTLGPDNAAAVAEICRLCDGVPLALELVAAQAAALGGATAEIEAGLLAAGRARRRDLPDRQRSIRAALDWSLQLLAPEDRELLASLAVFDGGFTLDAAVALLGRSREDVADRLADLVRRSLLITQGEPPRFHLLHLVRRQLLERLDASGHADTVRRRHADWCLRLAHRLHDRLIADPAHYLDEAIVEAANLRAAHKWAAGPGALAAHALVFAADLFPYWDNTARYSQARRCAAMALALPASGAPELARQRMRALRTAAVAAVYQGDVTDAAARFQEMGHLARRLEDDNRLAWTEHGLAACDIVAGRSEAGVARSQAAFDRLQALGDRNGMVAASVYLVQGLVDLERLDEARAVAERGLAIARDGASLGRAAYAHGALGYVLQAQGELETAQAHMEAALQLALRLRMVRAQARGESLLGRVLADRGEIASAAQHMLRALAIMVECKLDELLRDALIGAAVVLLRGDEPAAAVRIAGAAERASNGNGRLAPHDRRALVSVLEDAARTLDRGAYELACTEGRALNLREAALAAIDALKRSTAPHEHGPALVHPLRAVVTSVRRSA